jgi:hypothetical protein
MAQIWHLTILILISKMTLWNHHQMRLGQNAETAESEEGNTL